MRTWKGIALLMTIAGSARADAPSLDAVVTEGRAARRELMRMLDQARVLRDVVRATCYDAKLSAVNAAVRPLEAGPPARLPPRLLERTRERVARLVQEARKCVCVYPAWADERPFVVEVEVDPRIPRDDPSAFPR